ncbi:TrbG/VirB9 family P-type conjugative transfer protein [Sphingomonas adhaesiva]|uniref:TrbG/VirB9 family P-type conjugative transfer protein n=1 Tax=Sphingomonas adhaesiva TaxID=28212 RepID=UPI002FF47D2A
MKQPARLVLPLLLALGGAAMAQQAPLTPPGDPRFQTFDYRPEQVVPVRGAVGYQLVIELAPDETVRSVALGDAGAWQVNADRAGNRLFVKPAGAGAATNMTVVTDVRTYAFDLTSSGEAGMVPYSIRFRYPNASGSDSSDQSTTPGTMVGFYRLHGHRTLWPTAISDDGTRTFIDWPADGPLPATYVRDAAGNERLANGYMRGKFYVLDSVDEHLVFRLDKRSARADRAPTVAMP